MQSFIILAVGVVISVFGALQYSKNSNTTSADINNFLADAYSANFYLYNDLAISYLMYNYNNIYDGTLTSPSATYIYSTTNNFDYNSTLKNYANYGYSPKFNYKSTYFTYIPAPQTGVDANPVPVLYLLTNWNASSVPNISNKFTNSIISDMIIGNISRKLTDKIYSGDSTYWSIPIIGYVTNCNNISIALNVPIDNANSMKGFASQACLTLKSKGYNIEQNYFYLTPIINQ